MTGAARRLAALSRRTDPGPLDETHPERRLVHRAGGQHYCLNLILYGEQPLLGGLTFDLGSVKEMLIGRGGPLGLVPDDNGGARLDLPDPTVSSRHARLHIDGHRTVVIEDLDSRNGTRIRGVRVRQQILREGDWFVVGRSAFLLRRADTTLGPDPDRVADAAALVTFVPALAEQYRVAALLAPSLVPLLLVAPTGAGKEVLARDIHRLSRRPGAMVPVNCAALPESLIESELFGYRRGAFTEAREDRPGLIRAAAGGTLLLDEIGDLPLNSQAKLLRALQDGEVLSLGATVPVKVDFRLIAATHQELDDRVQEGRFRADLLGRLGGVTLRLPALRDRLEDFGLLCAAILERHGGADVADFRITGDACCALLSRAWPLNVRELERVLQAAVELSRDGHEIDVEHLGPPPRIGSVENGSRTDRAERLRAALAAHGGNVSAVARELGKARVQIQRWMKRFGLRSEDFRGH